MINSTGNKLVMLTLSLVAILIGIGIGVWLFDAVAR
jgi:hypothetical protein